MPASAIFDSVRYTSRSQLPAPWPHSSAPPACGGRTLLRGPTRAAGRQLAVADSHLRGEGLPGAGARPGGELQFGFHDLVLLRTASELSAAKIPQRKVLRVLERLRAQLPSGRSLTGVRITADGENVIVRDGGAVWIPESGQSLFDFSVADLEEGAAARSSPCGR